MTQKAIYETYTLSFTVTDMIYRVARRLRHQANLSFKRMQLDITPEQWRILLQLAEKDGQSQRDLADPVLADRPNITRLIDGLEKRGMVTRKPAAHDRRSFIISLTELGKATINENLPAVVEEKAQYYDGLNEKDIAALRRYLAVIESNISKRNV